MSNRAHDNALRQADAALSLGDTAEALRILERRIHQERPSSTDYVRLSQIYRARGTIVDRMLAQRVLEEGLRKRPDDPEVLVELGKTFYEQTFYGDAERAFERALSVDPDGCDVHYFLGINAYRKWKHVQLYTDYLATAIDHLRRTTECDPNNTDALMKLAFSRYVMGDTALAVRTCETIHRRDPGLPYPFFLWGTIAYDHRSYGRAWEYLRQGLAALPQDERTHYTDVALLLPTDDEREAYDAAGLIAKQDIEQVFWIERDPDPTTEINERLIEHLCRVFIADARFASDTPPLRGWETERGKALIKFGAPDHVRTTLEGTRPLDGRTEIWSYARPTRIFSLAFRDEYLNGNYVVPIEDEASAVTLYTDPPLTEHSAESASFPGTLDVVSFRDSDIGCTVYVTYAADDDTLQSHLWTWNVDAFVVRAALYDIEGRPQAYHADTLGVASVPRLPGAGGPSRLVVQSFRVPFNSYRVAFCFEDAGRQARSLVWSRTSTLRYLSNDVVMSDILLHRAPAAAGTLLVQRGAERLAANPRGVYGPSELLRVYIELYHLGTTGAGATYDITYSIWAAETAAGAWSKLARAIGRLIPEGKNANPFISQSFQRTSATDTAIEDLAIEIGALEPGKYVVSIKVLDRVSAARAEGSKAFTKLRAPAD